MSRRFRSRPFVAKPRPNDIPHDGGPCPVDPESRPGVMLRRGSRIRAGAFPASYWASFAEGDCWSWATRAPGSSDIMAYELEPEPEADDMVEVQRLSLSHPAREQLDRPDRTPD